MAQRKVLAREFTVQVDVAMVFTPIKGLTTIGFDQGKQDADTTDFDSDGWAEHMVAERNAAISLDGRWLEDPDTGALDAGQAALEELGSKVGADSLGTFRLISPGGTVREFDASVQLSGPRGDTNAAAGFQAILTRSGPVATT